MPWPVSTRIRILAVRNAHFGFLRPALVEEMLSFELEQAAQAAARQLEVDLPFGVATECRTLRGPTVPTIMTEAARMDADLVVLGSRNRGPVRSTVLGSVGREIVARAEWPVLVAHGERTERVLLAHDGSGASRAAVRMLGSWPIFTRSAVKMFSIAGSDPGPATGQILTAAELEDTDLIVLGAATAHGFDRLVHGDLADDLVTRARRSLLIVPEGARVDLGIEEPSLIATAG